MIWTILSIISLIIFILFVYQVIKKIKLININFNIKQRVASFKEDICVTEDELQKTFNNLNETSKTYIGQYTIDINKSSVHLNASFLEKLSEDMLVEIHCFDDDHEIIETLKITYDEPISEISRLLLVKSTKYINLYVYHKDDEQKHLDKFIKAKHKAFKKVIRLESISLMFLFVPVGYFMLRQLTGEELITYMTGGTLALGFSLMILVCIINYMLMIIWIKFKGGGIKNEHLYISC